MKKSAFLTIASSIILSALMALTSLPCAAQLFGPTTRTPRLTVFPGPTTLEVLTVNGTSTFGAAAPLTANQLTISTDGFVNVLGTSEVSIEATSLTRCAGCELDTAAIIQADETRVSTTVLADSGLAFTINSATWHVEAWLLFTSASAVPDVKIGWRLSAAPLANSWIRCESHETTTTALQSVQSSQPAVAATTLSFDLVTGGNVLLMSCRGSVAFAGTQTLALQFAQVTSNATATTLLRGSWWKIRQN